MCEFVNLFFLLLCFLSKFSSNATFCALHCQGLGFDPRDVHLFFIYLLEIVYCFFSLLFFLSCLVFCASSRALMQYLFFCFVHPSQTLWRANRIGYRGPVPLYCVTNLLRTIAVALAAGANNGTVVGWVACVDPIGYSKRTRASSKPTHAIA